MFIFVYYNKSNFMKAPMSIKLLFATCFFCCMAHILPAQNLSLYSDYLNKVYIFNNGITRQVEHLPLRSYQIGNQAIAYEDNAGNFKVFQNNYLHNVSAFVSQYIVTDNLIIYRLNSQLKVFDNGQNKSLCTTAKAFAGSDEVVIFFDDLQYKLMAYYNSELFELDDALNCDSLDDFICGENTIVYRDSKDYYHIFYKGEIFDLPYYERIKSYKAGRDIAAFVEGPMNNFQVFYNDDIFELESFEPVSYNCGDGLLAYTNVDNYLKVFNGGKVITLSFDKPGFFSVVDEMVIFSVQNDFKVFVNGQTYTLENYIPEKYLANNQVIVYTDDRGCLKIFENGSAKIISYEKITGYELHGNTVYYSFGVQSENIYSKGKITTNN